MKGIVLAGGSGTRLYPITKSISKQLLPVYDKPMIYYPLSVLMLADITEILIISNEEHIQSYENLLGGGENFGISIAYAVQENPNGLAEAFILGEEFIGTDSVCLILGDNVFYGQFFSEILSDAVKMTENNVATIFGYPVNSPKEFGVVEFDDNQNAISIEEKPENPKSHYAVPGLYFYDNDVIEIAKTITPSARGELEITAINNVYLQNNALKVIRMGRGMAWLDTGTANGLHKASSFVRTVQDMQGLYVACLEEIAFHKGYIKKEKLRQLGQEMASTEYGQYILQLAEDHV